METSIYRKVRDSIKLKMDVFGVFFIVDRELNGSFLTHSLAIRPKLRSRQPVGKLTQVYFYLVLQQRFILIIKYFKFILDRLPQLRLVLIEMLAKFVRKMCL